jgi:uncharacterized protein (DUF58 family)
VNWPATARHGEIMVRQEEQRSTPEALIILDTTLSGRPSYSSTHAGDRMRRHDMTFELAIEVVASVGAHLLDAGFRLNLLELGPSQLAPGSERRRGGLHGDAPSTYRTSGGDRLLLEALATVVPVHRADPDAGARSSPRASVRFASGPVPTFAVLVDIDGMDAKDLAAARSSAEPAVAFVLETMSRGALEALEEAGWLCIPVRTVRDIPEAWGRVQQERGSVHDVA